VTLDDFYKVWFSDSEIASVLLLSYIFNRKLYDTASLKSFLNNRDCLNSINYWSLIDLYKNIDKFSFINGDLFIVSKFILCDKQVWDFISSLVNYLNNKFWSDSSLNAKIDAWEFIILYLFFKNEGSEWFNSYDDVRFEYFRDFKGVDFTTKDFKKKYASFLRNGKYKFFSLKCIKFTFEHFIKKSGESESPFEDYIGFWKRDDIWRVDKIYENSNVMSLLNDKFGIRWRELLSVVDYDIDLNKLEWFINLFADEWFLSNNGIEPSSLNLSLCDIVQYLKYSRDVQLYHISLKVSKLSDNQVVAAKRSQSAQIKSISDKFWSWNVPYNYPEPDLSKEELGQINLLQSRNEARLSLIGYLNGCISKDNQRIGNIKSNSPWERSRVVGSKKRAREEGRKKCDDYFKSWITIDNCGFIFSEYVDIIFDGDDCDKYLSQVPSEVINSKYFFDKLFDVSFWKVHDSSPKNYYRVTYLFKYLSVDALNYAFTCMLNSWYLNVMIWVCLSDKKSSLYNYILSKYSEMKAENKVKLLPYINDIHFVSDDDCRSFFDCIISEFWCFPLVPYRNKVPQLKDFHATINSDEYLENCKKLLLFGEKPIENLYTYWSWSVSWDISWWKQKFLLETFIFDSENCNFGLVTNPEARYHKDMRYGCCWDILCWWYLKKSETLSTIFVFGSSIDFWNIPPRLYPVIEDILRRQYPWYDVEFWNPDYGW